MISVMKSIWPARLNILIRIAFCSTEKQEQIPAYKLLLRNSVENQIKIPSQFLLRNTRTRGIVRVMQSNHTITDKSKILETHIQCLYALTQRSQPSIEAYSMFTQMVISEIYNIQLGQITPAFLNLYNLGVVPKLCRIVQSIDSFYNETFRTLTCSLIFKLLFKSNANYKQYKTKIKPIILAVRKCLAEKKSLIEENGNVIEVQDLEKYQTKKEKQYLMEFRVLDRYDYLCGFRTLANLDYYQQDLFNISLQGLNYEGQKYFRQLKIHQIINFLQIIYDLQRYKSAPKIQKTTLENLTPLYNRLVDLYFKQLSNQQILFELVNSDGHIIQSHLITQFITMEQFDRAKKVYLNVFKITLNSIENGALLIDIRRLRGFFEVILIMFNHQDTKDIHQLLRQLQKLMILYPLQRFRRLETHSTLCEKYSFQSQIIAQQYFHYLLYLKQKNDRFRANLHILLHCTRQIILARKFLIYLLITPNKNTQKAQLTSKIINSYFQRSIWPFLDASVSQGFLDASSFYNYIYYQKHGIVNLATGFGISDKKKIDQIAQKLGLKNINSNFSSVQESHRINIHRYSAKTSYLTQWKDNPHARMTTIFQLAAFNYQYLKKTDTTAAENFMQQFMSKTISSPQFYNIFKQKIGYPGLFKAYNNLMNLLNPQSYTLQFKDLEAIKKIYQKQLIKLLQSPKKPPFQIIYQGYLDLVQFNRVLLPHNNEIFGLLNVGHSAYQTEICSILKMFEKPKEALRAKLQHQSKINKAKEISFIMNFIEYPHFADFKVITKFETTFLIFRSYQGIDDKKLTDKHIQSIAQSKAFWKKNGHIVYIIESEKDIDDFMKKKILKSAHSR